MKDKRVSARVLTRFLLRAAAGTMAAAKLAPALAQPVAVPVGALEAVTASEAVGWACLPGSGAPVSIAFYAGFHLIGMFPAGGKRPDVAGQCGADAAGAGFTIGFTPVVAQQFLNQSSLRFVAVAGGQSALLPPATPAVGNPWLLPGGLITGLSTAGVLSGAVYPPGAGVPAVDILRGGPAGSGGQRIAAAALQGSPGAGAPASFSATLPNAALANLPSSFALSLFARGTPAAGPAVQLGSPSIVGAAYINLSAQVAQGGDESGIINTLLTRWVSGHAVFSGLTGALSLTGSAAGFREALVTFGFTGDTLAGCRARNNTTVSKLPAFTRLAGFILKGNAAGGDVLPVSLALPYGVGLGPGDGVCLLTWVSAGYPTLSAAAAAQTVVNESVAAAVSPRAANSPVVIPEGLGNEFLFPGGAQASVATLTVLRAKMPLALDEIAGSVSAGGVTGAPAGSAQAAAPVGGWIARTQFAFLPAQICATLGIGFGAGNPYFATALVRSPQPFTMPDGVTPLLDVPLQGLGATVTQQSFFQSFPAAGAPAASSVRMQPGDCLAAVHTASGRGGPMDGALDFENQSTVYLRANP